MAAAERPAHRGFVLFLGATFFVLPAIIIAQTAKYQESLVWGWAHISVYMQFFGLTIILVVVFAYLAGSVRFKLGRRAQIAATGLLALSAGAVSATSFMANRHMIEHRNRVLRYPREFLANALERGLLRGVPEGSIILRESLDPWDLDSFYAMHGHVHLQVLTPEKWLASQEETFYSKYAPTTAVFELRYEAERRVGGAGWALLSRIQEVKFRKRGKQVVVFSRTVQDPVTYVQEVDAAPSSVLPAIANGWLIDRDPVLMPVLTDLAAVPATQKKDDWRYARLSAGRYQDLTVGSRSSVSPAHRETFLMRDTNAPGNPLRVADRSSLLSDDLGESIAAILHGCDNVDARTVSLAVGRGSFVELKVDDIAGGLGLAFLVKPRQEQSAHAVLASNHSGQSGLTFEHDGGADPSQFTCTIGNGTARESLGYVSLPADQWSLVIIGIDQTGTRLEVIGNAGSVVRESRNVPAVSPTEAGVFRLGNWIGSDRAFNGLISSISVAAQPFDAQQRAVLAQAYKTLRSNASP
jgi:High-affinity Fe2+/Pb2+ permease